MENEPSSNEAEDYELDETLNKHGTDFNYRHRIVWPQAFVHASLHVGWLCGVHALFYAKFATILWSLVVGFFSAISIAIGAHRLYTHKSYKPTPALEIILNGLQLISGQNSMFTWARDHKIHHKYSDTDADPHNSSRGFFFSHIGWLMVRKHPLLLKKMKEIDVSELLSNKYVMFQYKYFFQLYFVIGFAFPISVPMYFWNETFWNAFCVSYCFQYVTTLHLTWGINSFAHLYGTKPFDKRLVAKESPLIIWCTGGEGYHNYHHAFPWDYRVSEYGRHGGLATAMIDLMAYLGLAYDLKTASADIVIGHSKRHGDENAHKKITSIEKWKMKEAAKSESGTDEMNLAEMTGHVKTR